MKNLSKVVVLLAAFTMACLPPALLGQDWGGRAYVRFDGGPVWAQETNVRDLFGAVPSDTRAEFDVGGRFGLEVGYSVTDWFAAEFETAIMGNSVRNITHADDVDATVYTVPLFLNARFQLPTRSRFTPYIGGGFGGTSSVLDVDHMSFMGTYFEGSASDIVFAFQGFAGFRVALSEHMGLGLEYRFVHSDAPTYEVDWGWAYNVYSDHVAFGDMNFHMACIRFDMTF